MGGQAGYVPESKVHFSQKQAKVRSWLRMLGRETMP
jgi:hypothetical protein